MRSRYLPSLAVALAFLSMVSAADPNPLQDFCVGINSTKDAVYVNGKFCKDPKLAVPDDFFITGMHLPRNTNNPLGTLVSMFNADNVPGLNSLGVSVARLDFGPYGVNPPHVHPRASEVQTVLEGTLFAGFVTSNPDHRLFSKILHRGDSFVFPMGLVHFQRNLGSTPAVCIVSFGSSSPGLVTMPNAIFGSNPPIPPDVLDRAFQLDKKMVEKLERKPWFNNG